MSTVRLWVFHLIDLPVEREAECSDGSGRTAVSPILFAQEMTDLLDFSVSFSNLKSHCYFFTDQ